MPKFLRRAWQRHSKLGKRRKNKQKWRRPTGRHNSMRQKEKGYAPVVSIGYRTKKADRDKIEGKKIERVMNVQDVDKLNETNIIVVGNVGRKKMIEIIKRAQEKKIEVQNLNVNKIIKRLNKAKETKK